MTGFMNFSPDPISQITVGTLADLGWTVDPAGAGAYTARYPRGEPAFAASRGLNASRSAATAAPRQVRTDRLIRPQLAVSRSGRRSSLPH
jgi:hypothetical protein